MNGSSDQGARADEREVQPRGRADVAEQRDSSDRMERHSRPSTDVTATGDRTDGGDDRIGARVEGVRVVDAERTGAQIEAEAANEQL